MILDEPIFDAPPFLFGLPNVFYARTWDDEAACYFTTLDPQGAEELTLGFRLPTQLNKLQQFQGVLSFMPLVQWRGLLNQIHLDIVDRMVMPANYTITLNGKKRKRPAVVARHAFGENAGAISWVAFHDGKGPANNGPEQSHCIRFKPDGRLGGALRNISGSLTWINNYARSSLRHELFAENGAYVLPWRSESQIVNFARPCSHEGAP